MLTILGTTNARAKHVPFGIRQHDRLNHMYVVGETDVGKTTFLQSLFLQDIAAGTGCMLVDPHGDVAKSIMTRALAHQDRTIEYIDISDPLLTLGYNPLTRVSAPYRPLVASGL